MLLAREGREIYTLLTEYKGENKNNVEREVDIGMDMERKMAIYIKFKEEGGE